MARVAANTERTPAGMFSRARTFRAAALPPAERRAAIIRAALPLLRQHGHDVTTRQIAQAAGIAEGTVFRAFDTKQHLVDAAVAQALDVTDTVSRIRAVNPAAPLAHKIRDCAVILTERLSSVIELMTALRMYGPPPDPAGERRRHSHHHTEVMEAVTTLLEPDSARLTVRPARAARLLRLLAFAGTHRMINDGDPLSAVEMADVLLYGIVRDAPPADESPPPLDDVANCMLSELARGAAPDLPRQGAKAHRSREP